MADWRPDLPFVGIVSDALNIKRVLLLDERRRAIEVVFKSVPKEFLGLISPVLLADAEVGVSEYVQNILFDKNGVSTTLVDPDVYFSDVLTRYMSRNDFASVPLPMRSDVVIRFYSNEARIGASSVSRMKKKGVDISAEMSQHLVANGVSIDVYKPLISDR